MANRKPRRDARFYRERILSTAHSLFKKHGVHEVSMHQIAQTAGVGQGTLYRKYAHKGALCLDLLEDSFHKLHSEISSVLRLHRDKPAADRLEAVLDIWVNFMETKMHMLGAIQASCESSGTAYWNTRPYHLLHGMISGLYSEMAANADERSFDPDFAAHMVLSSLNPFLYFHLRQEQVIPIAQIKHNIKKLYIHK